MLRVIRNLPFGFDAEIQRLIQEVSKDPPRFLRFRPPAQRARAVQAESRRRPPIRILTGAGERQ
jgi:hypothetical protein